MTARRKTTRTTAAAGDLFADAEPALPERQPLGPGAILLRGFALAEAPAIWTAIGAIAAAAPFRHMMTPGGHTMSVAMTNCGAVGWMTDRTGYRYAPRDPESGKPWPPLPESLQALARRAAAAAGYAGFAPDSCLINRYQPGARMTLHQDLDEGDMTQPIVSVSLGLPATFLFGGAKRSDRPQRLRLVHGDIVAWGGPSRLFFHGVDPVRDGEHPLTGRCRINLTFRAAR